MSQIQRILEFFNLPDNARGEQLLQLLDSYDFGLGQYQETDRFDILYKTMMDIRERSTLSEFSTHEKLDLTIYIGCLLKLKVQPNQEILDLFISRSRRFVDTMVIRQHYYNHKKSKKVVQLEIVLGYKFSDFQISDAAKVIFSQYFYPMWIRYILGDEKIRGNFKEVFLVVEKAEIHSDSQKVQIQQLEVKINAKLALKLRTDAGSTESDRNSSKSFEPQKESKVQNNHSTLFEKAQFLDLSQLKPAQQSEKKAGFPANICDLFQTFDEPKKLHMADYTSIPFAEPVGHVPKTENESPIMALDFKAMDRQVIGHEELDDISNALLSIAMQSEKSQQDRKDQSLFSSFM